VGLFWRSGKEHSHGYIRGNGKMVIERTESDQVQWMIEIEGYESATIGFADAGEAVPGFGERIGLGCHLERVPNGNA